MSHRKSFSKYYKQQIKLTSLTNNIDTSASNKEPAVNNSINEINYNDFENEYNNFINELKNKQLPENF